MNSVETPSRAQGSLAQTPAARRLRILHVVPTYYPAVRYGGTIRTVHGLATASAKRGHDVHVYTTSVDGAMDMDIALDEPVMMDGVSVRYFKVPRLRRLYWSPALAARMRRNVRDFDVVHLHSLFLWPTSAAARIAYSAGVPYIMSPHGMLSRDLIRRKSRWLKTAWISLIEARTLRQAAALHVTSDFESAEATAMGLKLPHIENILHGVDWPLEHASLAEGPFANIVRPYVLFLSRISWKKGIDRLIEAWQWLPDMDLVIAGNDEENLLPKLRELARAKQVAERVHFVGHADDTNKWGLFESAEMFALPSYNENFGCVVAESMAMRCPVVLSREVGIADLVLRTGSGVVTDCAPKALAATIRALHADPERRRSMGERGREVVNQHFSWAAVAEQMDAVYRQAASQRRASPARLNDA